MMLFWKYYTKLWETLFIIPLLWFFYFIDFHKDIVFNVIIVLLLQAIVGIFLKYFFFKERPKKLPYHNFITKIRASAFPSLHSANTFLLFLLSTYYLDYSYSIFFFLFWFSIAYSRIVLKRHFYIDILSGMILSFLVYFLFLWFFSLKW